METPSSLPPMVAGLFGYLGYDMVRQMERLPSKNKDVLGVPESILLRPTVISIFDNVEDLVTVVTPVWPRKDLGARAAYDQACERLGEIVDDFDRNLPHQRDGLADLDEPAGADLEHVSGSLPRHGTEGEGVHLRRRHLSGGAVAAFLPAL